MVSGSLWASLEMWEYYPETAKVESMRVAALLSGEAHALLSSYTHDDADAWSESAWDEDEEYFTRWYEQQSLALQEDHWRLRCGTMSTVEPTEQIERWCEEYTRNTDHGERWGLIYHSSARRSVHIHTSHETRPRATVQQRTVTDSDTMHRSTAGAAHAV